MSIYAAKRISGSDEVVERLFTREEGNFLLTISTASKALAEKIMKSENVISGLSPDVIAEAQEVIRLKTW